MAADRPRLRHRRGLDEDGKPARTAAAGAAAVVGEAWPAPPPAAQRAPLAFKLQVVLVAAVAFFALSYFVTETWTWNVQSRWLNPAYWRHCPLWTPPLRLSEDELRRFDGRDPDRPVYLAIDGDVYDVSASRRIYGPGGGYHFFAGVDASRAYITGCFAQDLTHDLRGIDEERIADLDSWKRFYARHPKYVWVGRVVHPQIDPTSPEPPPCQLERYPGASDS